jgi:hypothetical protein
MRKMFEHPEDALGAVALALGIGLIMWLLWTAYSADTRHTKMEKNCRLAGGIPVADLCVKPGSFIEVLDDRF